MKQEARYANEHRNNTDVLQFFLLCRKIRLHLLTGFQNTLIWCVLFNSIVLRSS